MFTGLRSRFFRLHSATLFALPAVVVDAPAFRRLAGHARSPGRGKKKTANDFRGLAVLELFAADLAEDDAVVLAFGLPGGIVVAPGELGRAFLAGHKGKKRGGPRKLRGPPQGLDCGLSLPDRELEAGKRSFDRREFADRAEASASDLG